MSKKNFLRSSPTSAALLGALLLPALPAFAQDAPPQPDTSALSRTLTAGAVLYKFADECGLPEADKTHLFMTQLTQAYEQYRADFSHYEVQSIISDINRGVKDAQFFISMSEKNSEEYKRNCSEIKEKVEVILGKN